MWSFPGAYANRGSGTQQASSDVVPVVGLEPTRCRHRRILNPLRLPFHHTGTLSFSIYQAAKNFKYFLAHFPNLRPRLAAESGVG